MKVLAHSSLLCSQQFSYMDFFACGFLFFGRARLFAIRKKSCHFTLIVERPQLFVAIMQFVVFFN